MNNIFVNFKSTIYAIADSVIRERCTNGSEGPSPSLDKVVQFITDQHARMPDYLRFPFKCLVLVFDAWAIPFTGRSFHNLSHARRWQQIQVFNGSKLGFRRDMILFFETLTIFGWYSDVYKHEI